MLSALDICVNNKAPPTHSVHWGKAPPTHSVHWGIKLSLPQQAVVVFLVSEEIKFEVDASIILKYL